MSTANSASSTRMSAGMLSCRATVCWSYSGAAFRISSWTDSSVGLSAEVSDGDVGGVSVGATLGRTTAGSVSSGVVEGVTDGTSTLCDGSGCICEGVVFGVLGVLNGLGFFDVFAVAVCVVVFVGAVTVLVIVVSGSGVGVSIVVVMVTVVSGVMSHTSPASQGSTSGS